jgi:hypothetical protein
MEIECAPTRRPFRFKRLNDERLRGPKCPLPARLRGARKQVDGWNPISDAWPTAS